MTDQFIMKFDRFMDWSLLSEHYIFSIDMLRTYQHRVKWDRILKRVKLPECFLLEMVSWFDDLAWDAISKYQVLSESFIEHYVNKLDWENILLYQNVSSKFLSKHNSYYSLDL